MEEDQGQKLKNKKNSVLASLGTASMKSISMAHFGSDYTTRVTTASSRGHSGPIIPLIPKEARKERKGAGGFESQEPTSPKVSCIGRVKLKTKKPRKAREANNKKSRCRCRDRPLLPTKETGGELGKMSKLRRFFPAEKNEKPVVEEPREAARQGEGNNYPSLGKMKRFASGRESGALANMYRDSEGEFDARDEEDQANDVGVSQNGFFRYRGSAYKSVI